MATRPKSGKTDPVNAIVIGVGVVAIIAVAIWAAVRSGGGVATNAPLPQQQPTAAAPQMPLPTAMDDHDHEAELAVARMTVAELADKMSKNEAVAIDVRDIQTYLAGHIPGSMHIPTEYIQGELPWMPRDKTIVTYCT